MPSVGVEFDGELVACLNDTPLSAQQSYEECKHFSPFSIFSLLSHYFGFDSWSYFVCKQGGSSFAPLKCTSLHLTLNVKRIAFMCKRGSDGSCCAPGCFA